MPSQEMLDAAMKAVAPLMDHDIEKGLSDPRLGFFRNRITEEVHAHRAQLQARLKDYLAAGIDAAFAVPPVGEVPPPEAVIEPKPMPPVKPKTISPTTRKPPVGD